MQIFVAISNQKKNVEKAWKSLIFWEKTEHLKKSKWK